MPFLDHVRGFLQNLAQGAGQQFNTMGNISLVGPQVYEQQLAQAQENARQQQMLQAQTVRDQTLSAYQQAQLDREDASGQAQAQQQSVQNQLNLAKSVGAGDMRPADPGEDPDFWMAGEDGIRKAYKYSKPIKQQGLTLPQDIDFGNGLVIPKGTVLQPEDVLKYGSMLEGKKAKGESLQSLQAMQGDISDTINQRFSPNHYESVYGKGNVDPELDLHRINFQNRLKSAMLEDQARGNSTRLQGLQKDIDAFQSPWEKEFQKKQDRDYASNLAFRQHMDTYDMEHPAPSPEEVQAGLRSYKEYGLKALTGLRALNPRLALAVESEGAKQGLNPIALTNDEIQNRGLSKIALRRLTEAENVLNQPGMDKAIGPAISRFKTFMSGSLGSGVDQRVKQVQDALQFGMGAVGKIHYTARGSANQNIQEQLHKVIGSDRMDYPTLMQGIRDTKAILNDYALEGDVGDSNPVAGALGLPASNTGGLVAPRKGGR